VKNPRIQISGFPLYVTRAEFAAALGRSVRTIIRYEAEGLPVTRRGRTRLIPIDRAIIWLEGGSARRGRPTNLERGDVYSGGARQPNDVKGAK
jgi:hypothetical protein